MKYVGVLLIVALVAAIVLPITFKPISDARAHEIELQAQINAERARAKMAEEAAREEEALAIRRALTPALSQVAEFAVYTLSVVVIAAIVVVIGYATYSAAVVMNSSAHAAANKLAISSRMIAMNEKTRTYGLYFGEDMQYLVNPNTEAVYRIDANHESNPQAITALAQTQVAGVLAQAATAQHADAAAGAPLVIDGGGHE